jgi:hypothetical protein
MTRKKYSRRAKINKHGGDIVSNIDKFAKKIGIKLKNLHLPGHKYTGQIWA